MLADTTIISAEFEHLLVTSTLYEIMFRDGSAIGLHQVWHNGAPASNLRALRQGNSLLVFDLSRIVPTLGRELPPCPARDVPGLVYYTLRARFANAGDCVTAIRANFRTMLTDMQAANEPEAFAA
jgi:hypothetical protein